MDFQQNNKFFYGLYIISDDECNKKKSYISCDQ